MSENEPAEKTFQQRADEFIALANQQNAETEVENVNSALLFSAARFNVFSTSRQFDTVEKLEADKQEVINYFSKRYTEMLEQNFEEYSSRFDDYTQK
ncbi:hypothetical protein A9Q78_00160 [Methylophaga sp. 41_12_T18]|nr:hypothetical protein A9Q78_00160 [Methylophaga sp. 41_12_T18]